MLLFANIIYRIILINYTRKQRQPWCEPDGNQESYTQLYLFLSIVIRIHLNSCYTLVHYILSGVKGYKQKLNIELLILLIQPFWKYCKIRLYENWVFQHLFSPFYFCYSFIDFPHAWAVNACLRVETGHVRLAHRTSGALKGVKDFVLVVVQNQQRTGRKIVHRIPEGEETLLGALDLQTVKAGKLHIGGRFPSRSRSCRRREFQRSRRKEDLHVEVSHATKNGDDAGKTTTLLEPGDGLCTPRRTPNLSFFRNSLFF
ncbi:hypothetical protein RJT34_22926 [Clitoria ternatea]|uniref:Uncharacterized protein n=1 Tax=Clitoria ternatea TaxID=43366 RepID=A0AAN9FK09_CLITE